MAKQKHPTSGTVTVFYALAGQALDGTPGLYLGSVDVMLKNDGKEGVWYAEKDSPESKLLLNRAVYFEKIDVIISSAISGTYFVYCRTARKRDSRISEVVAKCKHWHVQRQETHITIWQTVERKHDEWVINEPK